VEHDAPRPLVLGRHLLALGVEPGPRMGILLKTLYEQQLDGAIATEEEGVAAARALIARR
jgi:tRNA nucleotidyltransferase (CCA-adding enzyme)